MLDEAYLEIIKDELNVKEVNQVHGDLLHVELDTKITTRLKHEGQMREIVRHVQNLRKQSGLQVDDRIELTLSGAKIKPILTKFSDEIKRETLATNLTKTVHKDSATFKVDEHEVTASIRKA